MERGSNQHGPRLDEELKHLTEPLERAGRESHVEEFREQEAADDTEPVPDERLQGGRATAGSLDLDEAEARSSLAQSVSPAVFPADRDALLASAHANQATEEVAAMLERLPAGQTYENVDAVWQALGGHTEHRF